MLKLWEMTVLVVFALWGRRLPARVVRVKIAVLASGSGYPGHKNSHISATERAIHFKFAIKV